MCNTLIRSHIHIPVDAYHQALMCVYDVNDIATYRSTGRNHAADKQHAASVRLQAEIAMCFAWGTVLHSHVRVVFAIRRVACTK